MSWFWCNTAICRGRPVVRKWGGVATTRTGDTTDSSSAIMVLNPDCRYVDTIILLNRRTYSTTLSGSIVPVWGYILKLRFNIECSRWRVRASAPPSCFSLFNKYIFFQHFSHLVSWCKVTPYSYISLFSPVERVKIVDMTKRGRKRKSEGCQTE